MRIYLDDDSVDRRLVGLLKARGHDVVIPADVGQSGNKDASHFMYAIRNQRALLTCNYEDYELLHDLVLLVGGGHPGVLVVRRDNDPTRDLSLRGIVRAISNLLAAGIQIESNYHILNHWR